jgi:hypothetical protein
MRLFLMLASAAVTTLILQAPADAQTRSQRCEAYARNATRATPTTTGAARGAARGAVVGSFSGNAGRGAAIGAGVGGTRRVAQKSRSFNWYYNQCMSR